MNLALGAMVKRFRSAGRRASVRVKETLGNSVLSAPSLLARTLRQAFSFCVRHLAQFPFAHGLGHPSRRSAQRSSRLFSALRSQGCPRGHLLFFAFRWHAVSSSKCLGPLNGAFSSLTLPKKLLLNNYFLREIHRSPRLPVK